MTDLKKYLLAALSAAFALTACGPRTIPDQQLALIIRDVFLVNAYQETEHPDIDIDSVDIYEPILDRYGYTNDDFRRSLNQMALKKSSRLSELIDQATADIAAENDLYQGRDRLRARIDSTLEARYLDTVFWRPASPIVVRRMADIDSLLLELTAEEGTYRLSFAYLIDSTDANGYVPSRFYLRDSTGRNAGSRSSALTRHRRSTYRTEIAALATADSLLIRLADYTSAPTRPDIAVDSILLVHTAPVAVNRDRYVHEMLGFDASDTYLPYDIPLRSAPDSGALHILLPVRAVDERPE